MVLSDICIIILQFKLFMFGKGKLCGLSLVLWQEKSNNQICQLVAVIRSESLGVKHGITTNGQNLQACSSRATMFRKIITFIVRRPSWMNLIASYSVLKKISNQH